MNIKIEPPKPAFGKRKPSDDSTMKIGIDTSQPSTKRGLIWVVVGVVGLLLLFTGHKDDIAALTSLGGIVAGGLGVALKD